MLCALSHNEVLHSSLKCPFIFVLFVSTLWSGGTHKFSQYLQHMHMAVKKIFQLKQFILLLQSQVCRFNRPCVKYGAT